MDVTDLKHHSVADVSHPHSVSFTIQLTFLCSGGTWPTSVAQRGIYIRSCVRVNIQEEHSGNTSQVK